MTDDIHKLSGAYATDALDDLERARFETHLASCEDCRAEVAELREAAARLADTTATPAPASLRESVLAGISQVRPLPPEVIAHLPKDEPDHDHVAAARGRRWLPFLVAAAVAVLLGAGALVIQPWAGDDEGRLSAADQVLQAADAEKVVVDLGDAGRATVVRSKSHDRAVIVTEDMVPAPAGKVYELWFQTPQDDMVPAGLMQPAENQTMVLEGSAADAKAVGITIEPEGGSAEPSGTPIALFDLSEAT